MEGEDGEKKEDEVVQVEKKVEEVSWSVLGPYAAYKLWLVDSKDHVVIVKH